MREENIIVAALLQTEQQIFSFLLTLRIPLAPNCSSLLVVFIFEICVILVVLKLFFFILGIGVANTSSLISNNGKGTNLLLTKNENGNMKS